MKNLDAKTILSQDLQGNFFFLFSGDHLIKVTFGNREVAGSPFVAKAYNTKSIAVTRLKDGFVGQPIHFESESLLKNVKVAIIISHLIASAFLQPRNLQKVDE